MHGRVSAVIHSGVQGVSGEGSLQQGPQDGGVAAGGGQVDGGAALEVSAQHERVVVQQGGQAVLTAGHCLGGGRVRGRSLSKDQEQSHIQSPNPSLFVFCF